MVRECEEDLEELTISQNLASTVTLTDEELLKACGGLTAHKGARHGLNLSGKLARIQEQERKLLGQMKDKETVTEDNAFLENHISKEDKKKKRKSKEGIINEDVAAVESIEEPKKKKKSKNKEGTSDQVDTVSAENQHEEINGVEKKRKKHKKATTAESPDQDTPELTNGTHEVAEEETEVLPPKKKKKKKKDNQGSEDGEGDTQVALLNTSVNGTSGDGHKKKKKSMSLIDDVHNTSEGQKCISESHSNTAKEELEWVSTPEGWVCSPCFHVEDAAYGDQSSKKKKKKKNKKDRASESEALKDTSEPNVESTDSRTDTAGSLCDDQNQHKKRFSTTEEPVVESECVKSEQDTNELASLKKKKKKKQSDNSASEEITQPDILSEYVENQQNTSVAPSQDSNEPTSHKKKKKRASNVKSECTKSELDASMDTSQISISEEITQPGIDSKCIENQQNTSLDPLQASNDSTSGKKKKKRASEVKSEFAESELDASMDTSSPSYESISRKKKKNKHKQKTEDGNELNTTECPLDSTIDQSAEDGVLIDNSSSKKKKKKQKAELGELVENIEENGSDELPEKEKKRKKQESEGLEESENVFHKKKKKSKSE